MKFDTPCPRPPIQGTEIPFSKFNNILILPLRVLNVCPTLVLVAPCLLFQCLNKHCTSLWIDRFEGKSSINLDFIFHKPKYFRVFSSTFSSDKYNFVSTTNFIVNGKYTDFSFNLTDLLGNSPHYQPQAASLVWTMINDDLWHHISGLSVMIQQL